MKKSKTSLQWIILFALMLVFLGKLAHHVDAINMDSSQYKIEHGDVLSTSTAEGALERYDITTLIDHTALLELKSKGYSLSTGFSSYEGAIPFSFSVSNASIDLGSNLNKKPSQKETTLSVSFGGAGSYTIEAFKAGPLQTLDKKNSIPDTKCNGGNDTCSNGHAALWTKKTGGFGFTLEGDDVVTDFKNNDYFRPFADINADEEPVVVVKTDAPVHKRDTVFRTKLVPSALQTSGSYSTIITFVAMPSF